MKKNILIAVFSLLCIGCNRPSNDLKTPTPNQPPILAVEKTGVPFLEFGDSCKSCQICKIDDQFLNGNKWSNEGKEMYITSVISGGKLTCFKINSNDIGPIPALSAGQVFPLNLYVPKDKVVEICNDFNSLIVSGIRYK
jgi:hypothetical protein